MTKYSEQPKKKFTRESIIGLGESSFKKNYYPELQSKLLELEKNNARSRAIIKTIPDLLLIGESDGQIKRLGDYINILSEESVSLMKNNKIMNEVGERVIAVIHTGKQQAYRFEFIQHSGYKMYYEARINPSEYNEALIIVRDITEQILLEHELREFAERDSMTQMYNRRMFEKDMFSLNKLEDQHVGIVMLDIDGLKVINDTLGHVAGDDTIRIVASMIQSQFSDLGLVARLSGDEFGVIGKNISGYKVEMAMEKMNIEINKFNKKAEKLNLSVSFGYAEHHSGVLDVRALFKEADNNMYQHKMFKSSSVRSSLVKTLMKALEARDFITEGHADRMEEAACLLGKAVGLGRQPIDKLKLLAKFHDIGKVGIPDSILNKPAKLTNEEFKIMKTHTQIGKRIALESVDLHDITDLIYYHHERWDGNGYPEGLAGIDIPIECRIIGIVDAFDAMTNDRPYRKAMTKENAIKEIQINSGTQFDPELAGLFLSLMN